MLKVVGVIAHTAPCYSQFFYFSCQNPNNIPKRDCLNVGTVPTYKMHNIGAVPIFAMHSVGTPKIYDIYGIWIVWQQAQNLCIAV